MTERKEGAGSPRPDRFDQLAQGLSDIPVIPEHERPQWLRLHEEWEHLENRRKRFERELASSAFSDNAVVASSIRSEVEALEREQGEILKELSKAPEARSWEFEAVKLDEYYGGYTVHHTLLLLPNNFTFRRWHAYDRGYQCGFSVVDTQEATIILEKMSAKHGQEIDIASRKKKHVDTALEDLERH